MPQITSIEPQRKKERLNIFLDGAFAFGVSAQTLLEKNLKVGVKLTNEQIDKIIKGERFSQLLNYALNYLSFRQRSEKEIVEHLANKLSKVENIKINQAKESLLISKVVTKLKKYNYLDDFEFAKSWIESRARSKPKGLRAIRLELFKKGIDKGIIDEVTEGAFDEVVLARKAIEKKLNKWQSMEPLNFKKKFYSYLLSRGFTLDTIKKSFAIVDQKD